MAAQSIGAAVVGIYPTSIGEELLHILTLAQVKVVVAEDQEQVDKLLKLRAEAAAAAVDPSAATSAPFADMPPLLVDTVVFYDPHGLEQYTDECPVSYTHLSSTSARACFHRSSSARESNSLPATVSRARRGPCGSR